MMFIQKYQHLYTIKQMCTVLKFARSSYYKTLLNEPSNKRREFEKFSKQVKFYYKENKGIYGAIKLHRVLNNNAIPCSIKRVQRHMQRLNIRSVVVKKHNHKANHGKVPDDKENILNRDFKTTSINEKWVTDITYIHVVNEGWTYLASVMDLHSRKIIGYAYGRNITAELALQAVKNATLNAGNVGGIILHTDLGSQYTSELFETYMQENNFIHSFSRKGNPYDNACIESFHATLKKEEIYLHTYHNFKEAQLALFKYIESWYNRRRIHSALDYKTPQQVEDEIKQVA